MAPPSFPHNPNLSAFTFFPDSSVKQAIARVVLLCGLVLFGRRWGCAGWCCLVAGGLMAAFTFFPGFVGKAGYRTGGIAIRVSVVWSPVVLRRAAWFGCRWGCVGVCCCRRYCCRGGGGISAGGFQNSPPDVYYPQTLTIASAIISAFFSRFSTVINSSGLCILQSSPGNSAPKATPPSISWT